MCFGCQPQNWDFAWMYRSWCITGDLPLFILFSTINKDRVFLLLVITCPWAALWIEEYWRAFPITQEHSGELWIDPHCKCKCCFFQPYPMQLRLSISISISLLLYGETPLLSSPIASLLSASCLSNIMNKHQIYLRKLNKQKKIPKVWSLLQTQSKPHVYNFNPSSKPLATTTFSRGRALSLSHPPRSEFIPWLKWISSSVAKYIFTKIKFTLIISDCILISNRLIWFYSTFILLENSTTWTVSIKKLIPDEFAIYQLHVVRHFE